MGELLPSKANPTEAQTMEYFQWDNERPGFCVQNLVQQSYHLLSDMVSFLITQNMHFIPAIHRLVDERAQCGH